MIRRPPRSTLFPTRRSSDLVVRDSRNGSCPAFHAVAGDLRLARGETVSAGMALMQGYLLDDSDAVAQDRKSTRLNSSHANISYAVFCLKKKQQIMRTPPLRL